MDAHQQLNCSDDKRNAPAFVNQQTNATMMKLQDLSDDCLLNIFSSKSLNLKDLCSLSETCKLFKRLTECAFPKEFDMKIGYHERDYNFTSQNRSEFYESTQEVERILKNCGQCLSSITIHRNDATVNDLVAKYCGAGTLKQLEMFTLKCTGDLRVKFASIYQRLLVLTVRNCEVDQGVTVHQFNCRSLIELNIINVHRSDLIMENIFPKLQRFSFEQIGRDGRPFDATGYRYNGRETLLAFIGRHTTLKTLNLNINFRHFMQRFVNTIVRCVELEELTLRTFSSAELSFDCTELTNLTKLRMLDVDIGDSSYCRFISLVNVLERLEILKLTTGGLFQYEGSEFLHVLSKLNNLRQLDLTNCYFKAAQSTNINTLWKFCFAEHVDVDPYYGAHITSIISRLANLQLLKIDVKREVFLLSVRDFCEIVKSVQHRSNPLTLMCKFNFGVDAINYCNKNGKVKLIKLK